MKKILVLSDLHCGSDYAILPKKFYIKDPGNKRKRILPNQDQMKLIKLWQNMKKDVGKVDAIFMLGDMVEGYSRKSKGAGLWSPMITHQKAAAVQLINEIPMNDPREKYLVAGTHYHVEANPNFDFMVADDLGMGMAHYDHELYAEVAGVMFHLSHHVGVSQSTYRTTALERERVMELLSRDMTEIKTDVIIRGHAHYHRQIKDFRSTAFINPAWQLRTPYLVRIGLSAQPEVGYSVITVDKKEINIRTEVTPFSMKHRVVRSR